MVAIRAQEEKYVEVGVKIYLNGFPKSGLHMLNLMAACISLPACEKKNWLGSFDKNAWSADWAGMERIREVVPQIGLGQYIKGHMGYSPEIEKLFYDNGFSFVFLHRDLRDVAVSQAHHILNENDERFVHPGKEFYRQLDSFEDVLVAVIEGTGEYPGLFERWELYSPWLGVPWVMKMRYEGMREHTRSEAERFCKYIYARTAQHNGFEVEVYQEDLAEAVDAIVAATERTELSPTYRKGEVGGWKEFFTPRVTAAFKAHAGDWLERLGYQPFGA